MENERIELSTPSEREVVFAAAFNAPRPLVFDALTKPEYISRWLTAPGRQMAVCEVDLRVGGAYRFVWRGAGKKDVGMRGEFREVEIPSRYVRTEYWEDWEAGEVLAIVELTEANGQTRVTTTVLFPSKEVRDEVLNAGMKHGLDESFLTLAEVIRAMTNRAMASK